MAHISVTLSCIFLALLGIVLASAIPNVDYEVIIVGGGPAGLSALSGLSRVQRKALLLDSGEYRNAATRNMHDVIGNDGTVPSVFRALAREQISKYKTAEMKNATVVSITQVNNSSYFRATDSEGMNYTARKIVLGTGLKDTLPNTPGIESAWGQGIYWCPWCDGFEHREQPLGVLGPLRDVLGSVLEVSTLNQDIVAFLNGTDTPLEESVATNRSQTWSQQLHASNVTLNNLTITSIERLQNGSEVQSLEEDKQFDKFRVNLADGSSIERSAFITNFPSEQRSTLPADMGLDIKNNKILVNEASMRTSFRGVFAVGDANSDGSTNVPHAMFSGKRAAVFIHVELAREESQASISKRGLEEMAWKLIGNDFEALWDNARI